MGETASSWTARHKKLVLQAHVWELSKQAGESHVGICEIESGHHGRISNPALAVCVFCAPCSVCRAARRHLPSTVREKGDEIEAGTV